MKIEIRSWVKNTILWSGNAGSLCAGVESAVKAGADLQGAALRGAVLQGAVLQGAALQGAALQGADLRGAALQGADLRGADLRGADLRGAALRGAALQGAALQGAALRGAVLRGAIKVKAFFSIGPLDGWTVIMFATSAGVRVLVGCHFFSLEEAAAHWRGKPDRQGLYLLVTRGWKILARMAGWTR